MNQEHPLKICIGLGLVGFTTLAMEIILTRILSVITWYHLAFFAVSTGMLGMTAGAVTVYLKPTWFVKKNLDKNISVTCVLFTISIPFSLVLLCLTPVTLRVSLMSFFSLLSATLGCTIPFYFSGIIVTVILTRFNIPIGKLYTFDLVGAAMGCLFVLGGLDIVDGPSLIIFCGVATAIATKIFSMGLTNFKYNRLASLLAIFLAIAGTLNSLTPYGIRPFVVKGRIENPELFYLEKWNSFSRVVVHKLVKGEPHYWGPSPLAPRNLRLDQYRMHIDGAAGTNLQKFHSSEDIDHLRYDVTNLVYYLRPGKSACIIGIGGGRDIQSALLFGHKKVLGIDINPVFVELLQNQFRDFAGIANRKNVTLIVDEARSYLSRNNDKYDVIQMSLIDTWAATGAGAFSLSENALYTVEAWKIFMEHLSENGIFTISRWYDPGNIGETGRVISLAMATLMELNANDPLQHLALVTSNKIATLILAKNPLDMKDIDTLKNTGKKLLYDLVLIPGKNPRNNDLLQITSARSREDLDRIGNQSKLNYTPTTDEHPYFFYMLKLGSISQLLRSNHGIGRGNLVATLILAGLVFSLLVFSLITVILPLLLKTRQDGSNNISWSAASYFSLIGWGFMFVEIALIQRLSIFLGHPVYALGILLFTIIASAGLGSLLSEKLVLTRNPWVYVYPLIISMFILGIRFILPYISERMVQAPMSVKILVSILVITPLGLSMGVCFPTGMRIVQLAKKNETPWYWALNGIFSVLGSALTVFVSIYLGVSISFYVGSFAYLMLVPCLNRMIQN